MDRGYLGQIEVKRRRARKREIDSKSSSEWKIFKPQGRFAPRGVDCRGGWLNGHYFWAADPAPFTLRKLRSKLADGLSPISAAMLATRIFYNYFSIELLFGVKDHFGKSTDEVVGEIARILRHGMLRNGHAAAPRPRKTTRRKSS